MSKGGSNDKYTNILLEIMKEIIDFQSLCHIEILSQSTPVDHPQAVQDTAEVARSEDTVYFLIRSRKERRINVDEIDLALEIFKQTRHDQFVIAPYEHVSKIVLVEFLGVEKLTLCFYARTRLVNRLDLLQGHRTPCDVHFTAVPIFIILALPHQLSLELRKGVRIFRSIPEVFHTWLV